MANREMEKLTVGLASKSAKMRTLARAGYRQADIADFLGTRPQFVSNVLRRERTRTAAAGSKTGEPAADSGTRAVKVRVGPDGRIVVPAAFRDALGLKDGDVLFAHLQDGEVHLLTPAAAMRRARAIVRQFVPEGVSLVDELLEDRRREVEREQRHG